MWFILMAIADAAKKIFGFGSFSAVDTDYSNGRFIAGSPDWWIQSTNNWRLDYISKAGLGAASSWSFVSFGSYNPHEQKFRFKNNLFLVAAEDTSASGGRVGYGTNPASLSWSPVLGSGQGRVRDTAWTGTNYFTIQGEGGTQGFQSTGAALTSWTFRTVFSSSTTPSSVCSNEAGTVVATGYNTNVAYSTNNGASWTTLVLSGFSYCENSEVGDGLFIVLGNNNVYHTSTNGSSWTQRTGPWSAGYGIAYGDGWWVVTNFGSNGNAYVSQDGISWTAKPYGATITARGVGYNGSQQFLVKRDSNTTGYRGELV